MCLIRSKLQVQHIATSQTRLCPECISWDVHVSYMMIGIGSWKMFCWGGGGGGGAENTVHRGGGLSSQ